MKKLRWTKPWFLVAAINGAGTRELTFAVMEFLEAQRKTPGARRDEDEAP